MIQTCVSNLDSCMWYLLFRSHKIFIWIHKTNEIVTKQTVSQKANAGLPNDLEESYVEESFVKEKFDQLPPSKYTQESSICTKFSVSCHLFYFTFFSFYQWLLFGNGLLFHICMCLTHRNTKVVQASNYQKWISLKKTKSPKFNL